MFYWVDALRHDVLVLRHQIKNIRWTPNLAEKEAFTRVDSSGKER